MSCFADSPVSSSHASDRTLQCSAVQEQQDFHFIIKTKKKKKKNLQYKVYISLNASAFKGNVIAWDST